MSTGASRRQSSTEIALFDAGREFEAASAELEAAALRVLRSGRYILGSEVAAFEREVAHYLGATDAVGVASGTDAIELGLRAVGIGSGDRVLTSPLTFFATASAILATGAQPVFADVTPDTLTLDPDGTREVLAGDGRIRAMIPVHLYGQPADMEPLIQAANDHGVTVIEDVAQAFGARYAGSSAGTLGDAGAFSFFPTKNLGGFGDGGLVATHREDIAERVRALRAHGATAKYHHAVIGRNSRLDELQAAMLRARLRHVDALLARRNELAERYDAALVGSEVVSPARAAGRTHTFHLYVIRVEGARDELRARLREAGIHTAIHYEVPLHLQEALSGLNYREGDFPVAERASKEILSLPLFPSMRESEVDRVAELVWEASD